VSGADFDGVACSGNGLHRPPAGGKAPRDASPRNWDRAHGHPGGPPAGKLVAGVPCHPGRPVSGLGGFVGKGSGFEPCVCRRSLPPHTSLMVLVGEWGREEGLRGAYAGVLPWHPRAVWQGCGASGEGTQLLRRVCAGVPCHHTTA
jgi:hypothetical protein